MGACPKCGSELVIRVEKKRNSSGQEFLGCSKFVKSRSLNLFVWIVIGSVGPEKTYDFFEIYAKIRTDG